MAGSPVAGSGPAELVSDPTKGELTLIATLC